MVEMAHGIDTAFQEMKDCGFLASGKTEDV